MPDKSEEISGNVNPKRVRGRTKEAKRVQRAAGAEKMPTRRRYLKGASGPEETRTPMQDPGTHAPRPRGRGRAEEEREQGGWKEEARECDDNRCKQIPILGRRRAFCARPIKRPKRPRPVAEGYTLAAERYSLALMAHLRTTESKARVCGEIVRYTEAEIEAGPLAGREAGAIQGGSEHGIWLLSLLVIGTKENRDTSRAEFPEPIGGALSAPRAREFLVPT
ncbi:hypothetical protein B0H11DRAFT_1904302 [Mycena galericulata]|nr:hypothetical protein B0H11DRAFT_1904302 [Mycena galericulata]